ncbi:MAG: TadE/TadG family type IV pilus assembly protein [Streptosporangiaceae bacterium]
MSARRTTGLAPNPDVLRPTGAARVPAAASRHGPGPRARQDGARQVRDAGPDRGSMSVELVVIAPALVLLLLLVAAGGRWVESHGAIDGAARDAARAASVARTAGSAVSLAQQSADADLATSGWCDGGTVAVGVTGFPPDGALVAPGDAVTVTVSCNVNMSPFTALGFNAASPVTGSAVAPLDPFMCRGANC